jgi:hypothetical protein
MDAVIMTVFDRPHYLKRVLASLDKLDGLRDLPLFFYVDGPYDAGSADRCAESVRLCKEFSHPQKTVIVRDKNVGVATQVYESKRAVFSSGHSAAVSLVDDIVCAPYALAAMQVAYRALLPNFPGKLFTIDVFNKTDASRREKERSLGVLVPGRDHGTYIMPKEVWAYVGPLLKQYIDKFIQPLIDAGEDRPYRERSSPQIRKWYGEIVGEDSDCHAHVTNPKYPSSQDGCVAVSMLKHGITPLSTLVNHACHIGEYGEHMLPSFHEALGLSAMELHLFESYRVTRALQCPEIRDEPRFARVGSLL